MYAGVSTAAKHRNGDSKEFNVTVGVQQGSMLSLLLFIIAIEASSSSFNQVCKTMQIFFYYDYFYYQCPNLYAGQQK